MLYLRGLSTGDFREALTSLLGEDASAGLSPSTITRLIGEWQREYEGWCQRDLGDRRYAYLFADGALDFWKALREVWPKAAERRCWVYRTANVLDGLPKRLQRHAKKHLHRYLPGRDEDDRAGRGRGVREEVRRSVYEGRHHSCQGRGGAVHVLRLSGHALANDPKHQRH